MTTANHDRNMRPPRRWMKEGRRMPCRAFRDAKRFGYCMKHMWPRVPCPFEAEEVR